MPVEELKNCAYYISGRQELVDKAISGFHVIHRENLANVTICAVYSHLEEDELERIKFLGLDISPVPIQKLFIYLTNRD